MYLTKRALQQDWQQCCHPQKKDRREGLQIILDLFSIKHNHKPQEASVITSSLGKMMKVVKMIRGGNFTIMPYEVKCGIKSFGFRKGILQLHTRLIQTSYQIDIRTDFEMGLVKHHENNFLQTIKLKTNKNLRLGHFNKATRLKNQTHFCMRWRISSLQLAVKQIVTLLNIRSEEGHPISPLPEPT